MGQFFAMNIKISDLCTILFVHYHILSVTARKHCRLISYRLSQTCSWSWFIQTVQASSVQHPPTWLWLEPLELQENWGAFTAPEIDGQHIHIRRVWSSVFKLWGRMSTFHRLQLFKLGELCVTKWSGLNYESRRGELLHYLRQRSGCSTNRGSHLKWIEEQAMSETTLFGWLFPLAKKHLLHVVQSWEKYSLK